jgi:hypothetical protein
VNEWSVEEGCNDDSIQLHANGPRKLCKCRWQCAWLDLLSLPPHCDIPCCPCHLSCPSCTPCRIQTSLNGPTAAPLPPILTIGGLAHAQQAAAVVIQQLRVQAIRHSSAAARGGLRGYVYEGQGAGGASTPAAASARGTGRCCSQCSA